MLPRVDFERNLYQSFTGQTMLVFGLSSQLTNLSGRTVYIKVLAEKEAVMESPAEPAAQFSPQNRDSRTSLERATSLCSGGLIKEIELSDIINTSP
jgi:hypothetical protein